MEDIMNRFNDIIGKTITSIVPTVNEDDKVTKITITFSDDTSYIIWGGGKDWAYDGQNEYEYQYIDVDIFKVEPPKLKQKTDYILIN